MRPFIYERPATLAEAVGLLAAHPGARPLAGGTDLIIRLRDGTLQPEMVIDLKRVSELEPAIREEAGRLSISATTVMSDIAADQRVRDRYVALAEAAAVVGAVQIRNRATLAGNLCNASPAADTAPALLVYEAEVVAVGPRGPRRIRMSDFFIRSGQTSLAPDELVTAIELPLTGRRTGSAHLRRTRRRGHDLAAITMACLVDEAGTAHLAYGSVGPRPFLATDQSGVLTDPDADDGVKAPVLDEMLAQAAPSPGSMRASPEYRLAMLRVLARRGLLLAIDRLRQQ